jgi:hypothetical protein
MAGRSAVHAKVSWAELGDDPTGGVHLSVEEERASIPFRVEA